MSFDSLHFALSSLFPLWVWAARPRRSCFRRNGLALAAARLSRVPCAFRAPLPGHSAFAAACPCVRSAAGVRSAAARIRCDPAKPKMIGTAATARCAYVCAMATTSQSVTGPRAAACIATPRFARRAATAKPSCSICRAPAATSNTRQIYPVKATPAWRRPSSIAQAWSQNCSCRPVPWSENEKIRHEQYAMTRCRAPCGGCRRARARPSPALMEREDAREAEAEALRIAQARGKGPSGIGADEGSGAGDCRGPRQAGDGA